MNSVEQLTLPVNLPDELSFSSYWSGVNDQLVSYLQNVVRTSAESKFSIHYIHGELASGKSHLLCACCQYAYDLNLYGFYLDLAQIDQLDVEMLKGLETANVICIDNVQSIQHIDQWQFGLFDLINRCLELDKSALIVCGSASIASLDFSLNDLNSRLMWGATFKLDTISDLDKQRIITHRATQLGMSMSEDVTKFLLNHKSRSLADLMALLSLLDKATLQYKRPVTIPMIKAL